LTIFFKISPEIAVQRVLQRLEERGRNSDNERTNQLSFYEAGLDLKLASDPIKNFQLFHNRTAKNYDKIFKNFEVTTINSNSDPEILHQQIMKSVLPLLPPVTQYKYKPTRFHIFAFLLFGLLFPFFMAKQMYNKT
jgi:thymidylate kinase